MTVLAGLGEKGLRKVILSGVRQSKITKWTVLAGLGKVKVRVKYADQKGNSWKKKKRRLLT